MIEGETENLILLFFCLLECFKYERVSGGVGRTDSLI